MNENPAQSQAVALRATIRTKGRVRTKTMEYGMPLTATFKRRARAFAA